jgi:putative nucleotidyltransferase with HDIG domain
MVALCKNVAIYPIEHPSVVELAAEIQNILKEIMAERSRVSLTVVNAEIFIENQLLVEESMRYSDFVGLLMSRGINNLVFEPEINHESLAIFFSLISKKQKDDVGGDLLRQKLEENGCVGISFKTLLGMEVREDVYEMATHQSVTAQASYQYAIEHLRSLEQNVLANKPVSAGGLRSVVSSLMGDFLGDEIAAMGLMNVKNYEEHTFNHSINVAVLCLLIASRLPLSERQVEIVGVAGLLHDIGKLRVPKEILNKPAKLNDEEWETMKHHPLDGALMLLKYENLGELPMLAALEHHAGYNMSGYPEISGATLPHAVSRIVCVADVFEALTASRCYRPAFKNAKEAVNVLISGSGKQFDPLLVKHLINIVGAFPVNTTVLLGNGETAVVVDVNQNKPFHPKIQMIDQETGEPDGDIIDIAEHPAEYAIAGVADTE